MILKISAKPGRGIAPGWTAFRKRTSEAGSLIVEALVGGLILGLVTISLYGAFSFGFASVRLSQETVRADQIAVENLEMVRVYDWSKVTTANFFPTNFTATFTPGVSGTTAAAASGAVYTGSIAIAPAPLTESYGDTLRQVTVTVGWTSAGVPRSRSMTTLVSQNGIQTYKN
jgi:hypothetical protein